MLLETRGTSLEHVAVNALIVSRGHGRGHAVPDMAIAGRLKEEFSELSLRYVSYSAGAEAYRACGYDVIDLEMPANPPFLKMLIKLAKLFADLKPQLIISHEEISAVPAAEIVGAPCIFITDFFLDPHNELTRALESAAEIIFLGKDGLFTEPPHFKPKISYVGRAVRPFEYTRADRERARQELDVPPDALVVLCQPGAWIEARVPMAKLLRAAWKLLAHSPRLLIWLAGRDYEKLALWFRDDPTIRILKEDWQIDRLMAASDVLITKANRVTVFEGASLGLPSISISNQVNWPDDVAVAHVASNTCLTAGDITPEELSTLITKKMREQSVPDVASSGGIAGAAARIANYIRVAKTAVATG